MDVWHWTSLVVLLAYAGLVSIPEAYYQAAKIDGASRWAVFRYIQLPKMKRRADDRDPAALHGQLHDLHRALRADRRRAGQLDHILSIDLVKIAIGQFDLGPAAAYVDHVLPADPADHLLGVLHGDDQCRQTGRKGGRLMNQTSDRANAGSMNKPANLIDTTNVRASNRFAKPSLAGDGLYILFLMLPIYWLINMSFKTNQEILAGSRSFPPSLTLRQLHRDLHRSDLVLRATSTR
jgi:hypothetical protein